MSANALLQHNSARNPSVHMRCSKCGSVRVAVVEREGEGEERKEKAGSDALDGNINTLLQHITQHSNACVYCTGNSAVQGVVAVEWGCAGYRGMLNESLRLSEVGILLKSAAEIKLAVCTDVRVVVVV